MSNVLIPFAKRVSDGQVVGIDEVPNGLACNCVCLSCNAALVAKTNVTTKSAHFAHHKAGSAGEACAVTFENSVLWMASELLNKPGNFLIPGLYDSQYRLLVKEAVRPYEAVETVEKGPEHLSCLMLIRHKEQIHPLGLTLYFPPDRPIGPFKDSGTEYPHVGINLDTLHVIWASAKSNFTEALYNLIFAMPEVRDWIYHPKKVVPEPVCPQPSILPANNLYGFTSTELKNLDALAWSLRGWKK
ncbi:MAG: hypothetical protein ACI832_000545 [Rheinheimera aquimaris]|jgi:hypothetical protein|uniref:hypothetical protein n=2 Tax=Rheinheimera aquimaris TaxID=412437 RepID=UPI000E9DC24A|nr:hypothetical protein [Rheinheimera sp.]